MKVGIIYNTNRKEATHKIVVWLKSALEQKNFEVVIGKMNSFQDFDCDAFIVGSAVYGFHVEKKFELFLGKKAEFLRNKPLATFLVCYFTKLSKMYRRGIFENLPSKPISHMAFKGYYNPSDIKKWDSDGQKAKAIEWVHELERILTIPIETREQKKVIT